MFFIIRFYKHICTYQQSHQNTKTDRSEERIRQFNSNSQWLPYSILNNRITRKKINKEIEILTFINQL